MTNFEKPLATDTLKFDIGHNTFPEYLVVMRKLRGPNIGLHLMRRNKVVIDTMHGLIHFPHLTMQVKTAASKASAKLQLVLTDDTLTLLPRTTK